MAPTGQPPLNPSQLAELSALADGSIDARRRDAVEAWISTSPQLQDLYAREREAVGRLRLAATDSAPDRLRARVQTARLRPARRPRRIGYGLVAGALAAGALVLAFALPAGTPGSPSVSEAAALALRGPAAPAPAPDPSDPRSKLAPRLQDLYFPNWSSTLGWHAVGLRRDRLNRQPAVTVYYRARNRSVAYTIVGSPVLGQPSAKVTRFKGFELRVLRLDGRTVVTWRRAGHTCVISARGVSVRTLEQLASWHGLNLTD